MRLMSIDAFRGFDMFWIMGFERVLVALGLFVGGGFGALLQTQMTHCTWEGLRLYDLVFPTFLFLAGVSWPFSYSSQVEKGRTRMQIYQKMLVRVLLLVVLGFLHDNVLKLNFERQRLWSVIGRIGVVWAISAILYAECGVKRMAWTGLAVLVGYFCLIRFVPAPGAPAGADLILDQQANIACWIDANYLTTMHRHEGGVATLGMLPTAVFGVLAGALLRRTDLSGNRKTLLLLAFAAVLAAVGFAWQPWCPCVKGIWTPTFACFAAAIAMAGLAAFYWIIDVRGHRSWPFFFVVIGMNSITIYMLRAFVKFDDISRRIFGGAARFLPEGAGDILVLSGSVALGWLVLYFLYRKKTFLKV